MYQNMITASAYPFTDGATVNIHASKNISANYVRTQENRHATRVIEKYQANEPRTKPKISFVKPTIKDEPIKEESIKVEPIEAPIENTHESPIIEDVIEEHENIEETPVVEEHETKPVVNEPVDRSVTIERITHTNVFGCKVNNVNTPYNYNSILGTYVARA